MTDLDIIKECRQTGKTRTTTKNLLQKAYHKQMTEIEKTEGEIKVLQAKLELLKEIENFKSPVEEAYKKVYGGYPPTTPSVSNFEDNRWKAFQNGYNAAQEDYEVGEYLKPHTPEQTEKSLREAFQKAQQTEEWKETQRKIDGKNSPEFLKFELGKTLNGLIEEWWIDVFTRNSDLSMEESIDCLVTMISYWLPKEQSAAGSQNVDVEFLVDGFNDAITKIRRKLR